MGASAEYELSTGDLGEVHLVVDEEGIGEAYFAINGHIVSHASLSESSEAPSPIVVSWVPTHLDYSRDLVVELLQEQVAATMLNGLVPQEFKCSAWGRKAVKAGKYLMIGVIGASAAACTAVSQGVATLACGAGAAIGIHGVAEFADDYCE